MIQGTNATLIVSEVGERGWGSLKTLFWNFTATVCNKISGEFTHGMGPDGMPEDVIRSNLTNLTMKECTGEKGELEEFIMDTLKSVKWLYGGPGNDLIIESKTGGFRLKNETFERISEPPAPEDLEGPYIYTDSKVSFSSHHSRQFVRSIG